MFGFVGEVWVMICWKLSDRNLHSISRKLTSPLFFLGLVYTYSPSIINPNLNPTLNNPAELRGQTKEMTKKKEKKYVLNEYILIKYVCYIFNFLYYIYIINLYLLR